MPTRRTTLTTHIENTVKNTTDADHALEMAWTQAEEYPRTVVSDHQGVRASATLDGISAHTITTLNPDNPAAA